MQYIFALEFLDLAYPVGGSRMICMMCGVFYRVYHLFFTGPHH